MISFHHRDNGRAHVCGHRGYPLIGPENTIANLEDARAAGATTCEIDIRLTRDGVPVLMHDATLDRTTTGSGFLSDIDLVALRGLEAVWRGDSERRAAIPTLEETLDWAVQNGIGLEIELKEAERPALMIERLAEVLERTGAIGHVQIIGFDHVVLRAAAEAIPGLRLQLITHARHADFPALLAAVGAQSVSIELAMFHPDDARALHDRGFNLRLHVPPPTALAPYLGTRHSPLPNLVSWLEEGLVDSVSGDDVSFLVRLREGVPG
ncbi:glycerophosphodiester phosphodiesterase [Frigidibacter sp. ROC022]|uniref:glycerophosphodiester phosphodiesterase n=1 Tax=Frigidibacter sp. ROC022 TaxID=2971796 RepID=UPI00215B0A4F|nr:glycerophosphodiester phosphodiesterase family protein [Frigidibacter sp. ROC022]MCR8723907.1 hypothetical protein [Frigidibacter sp. ROC022]